MAHYSTLHDYHFSADVDDIRGASVYGVDNEKLGKVDDVVLDHSNGEIRYIVVDTGHSQNHLVPSDHVFRSTTDEDSFEVNLRRSELESLPPFDEKTVLRSDEDWIQHEDSYRDSWRRLAKEMERRYKEQWHASPVQHRVGSTHDITPEPGEMPSATGTSEQRVITGADLTPERLAGKFPDPAPGSAKITENIAGTPLRSQDSAHTIASTSPRFQRFREQVTRNVVHIRSRCPVCCGQEKVA